MKKLFIISLFLIAILALGVSATKNISVSSPVSITEKPSKTFEKSLTIQNTGDENLTLDITSSGLADFGITLNPSSIFIEKGLSGIVKINGTVPDDIETERIGERVDGNTFSGTLTIKSGSTVLGSVNLNILAECQLDFKKIKLNGDSLDPDDKIDEIKPGDKLKFTGDIENLFTDADDEDFDIENVEITITIESIDDEGDDDLEESEDLGDIKPEDEESFSIEFEVPDDVDDGDYDILIIVEGEDENGAQHNIKWDELVVEVEKEKHDIWITKASISPSKVSCSRNVDIDVELKNQGTKDEDEVVLRIESSALDIVFEDASIPDIDEGTGEDTEYDKTYSFTIDDKVKPGVYSIKLTTYYDTDEYSNEKRIDLTVEKCAVEEEEEEPEEEEEVVVVTPAAVVEEEPEEEEPEILTTPLTETTEVSLLQSNTYLILLIGAVGVAVIVIIIMIIVLFSMKKRQ